MAEFTRYNSDKCHDPEGEWVRYEDVKHLTNIREASRFYLNAWGNSIWDESGDWIGYHWVEHCLKKGISL